MCNKEHFDFVSIGTVQSSIVMDDGSVAVGFMDNHNTEWETTVPAEEIQDEADFSLGRQFMIANEHFSKIRAIICPVRDDYSSACQVAVIDHP